VVRPTPTLHHQGHPAGKLEGSVLQEHPVLLCPQIQRAVEVLLGDKVVKTSGYPRIQGELVLKVKGFVRLGLSCSIFSG